MQKKYGQKVIGTSIIAAFIISLTLAGFSFAQAQFMDNHTSVIDGLVVDKSTNTVTLSTSGTEDFILTIDSGTVFNKNMSFANVLIGGTINATVRNINGVNVAKVIRINNATGYGFAGEIVQIHDSKFVSKSAAEQTITVKSELTTITFHITPSTKFINTSFDELTEGNTLQIHGTDSGTSFLAQNIILQ